MIKRNSTQNRLLRIRNKIKENAHRPRLCIYRSNKYIYAQIINDQEQKTIVGFSEKSLGKEAQKLSKIEKASLVGEKIAELALASKIKEVVFDRSVYKYHGKVKALAEGARKKGLVF